MKPAVERTEGSVGWGTALALAVLSLPVMALAILVVRAFLVPLLVAAVVTMALLALFVPPRYRAWLGEEWHIRR
jgi:Na+/glutamate symporter